MKFIKRVFTKSEKGQALLAVLVITTLTMLILLGVAARINLGRENVRRSGEFDMAYAASENALNDIITEIYSSNCIPIGLNDKEYKKITECPRLNSILSAENADAFAKQNNSSVLVDVKYPASILFGQPDNDTGVDMTGVSVKCENPSNPSGTKFLVSIISLDTATQEYKVLKGISDCFTVNSLVDPRGNIKFYDSSKNLVLNPSSNPQNLIKNVKLVRIRLLDNSPDTNISMIVKKCSSDGSACTEEGRTGSYEFMVVGLGGLGSDNIVKFELSKGSTNNNLNALFDFVYFGEDI